MNKQTGEQVRCKHCHTPIEQCGNGWSHSTFHDNRVDHNAEPAASPEAHHDCDGPCLDCGQPCLLWFAPNDLWNRVMGSVGAPGLLCPNCFIRRAQKTGNDAKTGWELRHEFSGAKEFYAWHEENPPCAIADLVSSDVARHFRMEGWKAAKGSEVPSSPAAASFKPAPTLEIGQTYGSECCNALEGHHPNCPDNPSSAAVELPRLEPGLIDGVFHGDPDDVKEALNILEAQLREALAEIQRLKGER